MSLIPGFEHDIFISYAHNDNYVLDGQSKGWVDRFHALLKILLIQRFGKSVNIWYDNNNLDGNTVFDDSIAEGINTSAILICINSPAYMKSDYCQQELSTFYNKAKDEKQGLTVSGKSRIIHVLVNNIPHKNWPLQLAGRTGFHFYNSKGDDHLGDPLDTASLQFTERMQDLRDAVNDLVNAITPAPVITVAPINTGNNSVQITNDPNTGVKRAPIITDEHKGDSIQITKGPNTWVKRTIAAVIVLALISVIAWKVWRKPSAVVAPPKVSAGSNNIPDKAQVRKVLLQISRLNQLSFDNRKHNVDSLSKPLFSPDFMVALSYEKSTPSAARIFNNGREYLYQLATNDHLTDIIVTGIKTDMGKYITRIDVVEKQKQDLVIQ